MRRALLLVAFLTLGACQDNTGVSSLSSEDITGTFSMRTVNGAAMPFTFQSGGGSVTVTADVLTVLANGTWSEITSYTQTINAQTTSGDSPDGGTWQRLGTSLVFRSTAGTAGYTGTFTGNGFTMSDGTYAFTFSK